MKATLDEGHQMMADLYYNATISVVDAGIDQTINMDESATLNGSIGGCATGAMWSGGGGTFNPDNITLNAIYTPSAAEISAGTVTLTLTSIVAGSCIAVSDTMTITINLKITDYDGNVYDVIKIGTQYWITKNLKVIHYADGTAIPNLTTNGSWAADATGAYCWYSNDPVTYADYGPLYNWFAVNNVHGIAPAGWRIPSDVDFNTLITYAGGAAIAGGKLKEIGLTHWGNPNPATNNYGFTLLGAGWRDTAGNFAGIKNNGIYWSSKEASALNAYDYQAHYDSTIITPGNFDKNYGFSIRCMKDI